MLKILSQSPSIINQFIAELRDVKVQKDSMRFRKNLERIGQCVAIELSKELTYKNIEVETPLGIANAQVPADELVLATILRAGLPLHQGLLDVFDHAGSAFVSAYRKHHKDGTFEIEVGYMSSPDLNDKVVIISDPMLATGASMVLSAQALLQSGQPKAIHFVAAVAARQGLEYVQRHFPQAHIWLGALDEELTAKSYIVPGLGDAGDLSFGPKIQD